MLCEFYVELKGKLIIKIIIMSDYFDWGLHILIRICKKRIKVFLNSNVRPIIYVQSHTLGSFIFWFKPSGEDYWKTNEYGCWYTCYDGHFLD